MVKANWKSVSIPRKMTATYKWSTPYVVFVHEGVTLRNGTQLPARPWTDVARNEFDFKNQFCYHFGQSQYNFRQAFINTAVEFGGVCQDAVRSPIWDWPRTTVRQSGAVVSSPRDAVDMGGIVNSYQMEVSG
jgi:hypothetical protein